MGKNDQPKREYHAPAWFLNNYVKTPAELPDSKIQLVPRLTSTRSISKQSVDHYEVEEERYTDLKYTTAGSVMTNPGFGVSTILDHERPSVTIESQSLAYGTGIVDHLARDLKATVVTVDADILLYLAVNFMIQETADPQVDEKGEGAQSPSSSDYVCVEADASQQGPKEGQEQDGPGQGSQASQETEETAKNEQQGHDIQDENNNPEPPEQESERKQEEEPEDDDDTAAWIKELKLFPGKKSAAGLLFACRCQKHASKGRFRRARQAAQAIVQAGLKKVTEESPCLPTDKKPVIIHVRGVHAIMNLNYGSKYIKNLRQAVQEYRERQEPVFFVGIMDKESDTTINSKFVTSPGFQFHFDLDGTVLGGYQSSFQQDEQNFALNKMAVMALENLHRAIAPSGRSKVLPDGVQLDSSTLGLPAGPVPEPDFERATKQILGYLMLNGTLEVQDFAKILKNSMQFESLDGREDREEEKTETTKSIATRLREISGSCNKYEQSLFSKVIDPGKQKATYDDVIVQDTVKDTMRHLTRMSHIQFEGSSQTLLDSARIKGALLYGPPGTGKTQLVRAMASDSHSNMIVITAADIEDKYCGEAEKRIAGAFSLARKLSPCVLFIDEVDALFYRRSSCDASWRRGNLSQFLMEMDGMEMDLASGKDAPFVIGATNHPTDLDEAFIRRLPYKVMFTLPGLEERKQILKIFLKGDDLDPLVSIDALAQYTEGLSGSDLRSFCGQAALDFAIGSTRSNENNDEPIRLQLDNGHIARALQKVQPSVTARSHKSIDEFKQQFNA